MIHNLRFTIVKKLLLVSILSVLSCSISLAQLSKQIYSANQFYSLTASAVGLTNAYVIQPWPPSTANVIANLKFIPGFASPPITPDATGSNTLYLYPNYYRITWNGLNYAATFAVTDTNTYYMANEVQSGAVVFWGTNNFQYQSVIDTNDTTPGMLAGKLAPGAGFYFTTNGVNGSETLVLNLSNSVSVSFIATNITGVLAPSNQAPNTAYVNSNNNWTASQNLPAGNITNLSANTLTIGSAVFGSANSAVVFTNATQAGINGTFFWINSTTLTNPATQWSVVTNGALCSLLNPSLQTAWTAAMLFTNSWTVGAAGTGTAPGSSPVTVFTGTIVFGGNVTVSNLSAVGTLVGTVIGRSSYATNSGSATNAQSAVAATAAGLATNAIKASDGYLIASTNSAALPVNQLGSNAYTGQLHVYDSNPSGWNVWAQDKGFNVRADNVGVNLNAGSASFVVEAAGIVGPSGETPISIGGLGTIGLMAMQDFDISTATNFPIWIGDNGGAWYWQMVNGGIFSVDLWGNTLSWTNGNFTVNKTFQAPAEIGQTNTWAGYISCVTVDTNRPARFVLWQTNGWPGIAGGMLVVSNAAGGFSYMRATNAAAGWQTTP